MHQRDPEAGGPSRRGQQEREELPSSAKLLKKSLGEDACVTQAKMHVLPSHRARYALQSIN